MKPTHLLACLLAVVSANGGEDQIANLRGSDINKQEMAQKVIEREHKKLIADLIKIVWEDDRGQIFLKDARTRSVELLGVLRAQEAVDLLITNIFLNPVHFGPIGDHIVYIPALMALVDIGKPAAAKCAAAIETSDEMKMKLLVNVVDKVYGRKLALIVLQDRLKDAKGEAAKSKLQAAITHLMKQKEGYLMEYYQLEEYYIQLWKKENKK